MTKILIFRQNHPQLKKCKMKSNKGPGEDKITVEMPKGGGIEICYVLCQILKNEEAPEECKTAKAGRSNYL